MMQTSPILFTLTQFHQLVANGERAAREEQFDPWPVCKLHAPEGSAIWLLTNSIRPTAAAPSGSAISASASLNLASSRSRN